MDNETELDNSAGDFTWTRINGFGKATIDIGRATIEGVTVQRWDEGEPEPQPALFYDVRDGKTRLCLGNPGHVITESPER